MDQTSVKEMSKVLKEYINTCPKITFRQIAHRFRAFSVSPSRMEWDKNFVNIWLKVREEIKREKKEIKLGEQKKAIHHVIRRHLDDTPYSDLPYAKNEVLILDELTRNYGPNDKVYREVILSDYININCLETGRDLEEYQIKELMADILKQTTYTMAVEIALMERFTEWFSFPAERFDELLKPVRKTFLCKD